MELLGKPLDPAQMDYEALRFYRDSIAYQTVILPLLRQVGAYCVSQLTDPALNDKPLDAAYLRGQIQALKNLIEWPDRMLAEDDLRRKQEVEKAAESLMYLEQAGYPMSDDPTEEHTDA